MLGDEATEYLKTLHELDNIWNEDDENEYSERQLVQFAERYYEHKLNQGVSHHVITSFDCEYCQDEGVMDNGLNCTCSKAPNE